MNQPPCPNGLDNFRENCPPGPIQAVEWFFFRPDTRGRTDQSERAGGVDALARVAPVRSTQSKDPQQEEH